MRLAVADVRLTDEFRRMAKACKAPLPWDVDAHGRVYDARGWVILNLEIAGEQDRLVAAHLIVLAVNTCGGFRACSENTDGGAT